MIIFDFDQTLVDTSTVEALRAARKWKDVMSQAATLKVYEGVSELLSELHQEGHSLAIVTKSPDMVPKWFIKTYNWPIDVVVGFHDVKQRKPHPEGLILAMERGKASRDGSFHIGDQPQDTEAARGAGIVALGASWGIVSDGELVASAPDHLFRTVGELATFFRDYRKP